MTPDLPAKCPACGGAYDSAHGPDAADSEHPDSYDSFCRVGTLHDDWPGWEFYHGTA